MLQRVRGQLEAQGLCIELTRAAKYLVVDRGYDPTMGARPLRRALRRMVEDALSEKILLREFRAGDTIIVDADNAELTFGSWRTSSRRQPSWPAPSGASAGEMACWPLPGTGAARESSKGAYAQFGTGQGNWARVWAAQRYAGRCGQ